MRLWDGSQWDAEPGQPTRFTLVLRHPGALRKMFLPPTELALGEAYIYDDFDIEGEIEAVFPLADYFNRQRWGLTQSLRHAWHLLRLPSEGNPRTGRQAARLRGRRHSINRDRLAVTYHYDAPNDFYKLWLDRRMVYSCACFATRDDDLDTAQERKLAYICRKLRLRPVSACLTSVAAGVGWSSMPFSATAWKQSVLPSASNRLNWPMSASIKQGGKSPLPSVNGFLIKDNCDRWCQLCQ